MKVKQLRLLSNCYALKSGHNFMASDHTKIERMPAGDYMVTLGESDPVIVGASQVAFAVCEPDRPSRVPVSELKK